jgi:ribonucleoside-diphosphate reductase alpha chain
MENGSVQNIPEIPTQVKEVYKTVWEMSQKRILQMAANRSIFIDQSQSLNLFIDNATKPKLLAAHLFGWKLGLKTGMYYLRTRSAVDAMKGLGINTSTEKPVEQTPSINNVEVPTNTLISERTPEVVMTSERPTDSPFECEGCGS